MNRRRRFLRRARLRVSHAARHHYMLVFSLTLLVLAGAASLGAFSRPDEKLELNRRVIAVAPGEPAVPVVPVNAPLAPRMTLTYYIVDSEEMFDSFNMAKSELRHREYLGKHDYEVLLVRSPEEDAVAQRSIDEGRARCVCAEFVVEDLRQRH